jgi:hypothetical protein
VHKPSFLKKYFLTFIYFIITLLSTGILLFADNTKSFSIHLENTTELFREAEVVKIELTSLIETYPDFDFNSFYIKENEKDLEFEITHDVINGGKILFILLRFEPYEVKKLKFINSSENKTGTSDRTNAYLGEKINYEFKDSIYFGGEFIEVKSAKIPLNHFPHDALYQFEGPGWESEKVGYRLYLDERNRTDIFGKKTNGLFLDITGKIDLISDGNESYQTMQDWGRDIFKVGNSLGIGSVATYYNNEVVTVSETDSIYCETFNNKLASSVKTIHYGWELSNNLDITTTYTILANSRLTEVDVSLNNDIENLCTGLAKHDNTEFFVSDQKNNWNYIALWGKQTLENDSLGIVVFYNKTNLIKISEDELSQFIILKPDNKSLTYYFAATWEQEPTGIKSKNEFINYLNNELIRLNNPIKINFD